MLTATAMAGCMAFGVNAQEVHEYKQKTINAYAEEGAIFDCFLHYYYDTANQNILTKVSANSQFIGNGGNKLTSDSEMVYLHNTATVTYADGTYEREAYRSDGFHIRGTLSVSERAMFDDPFDLNTDYRTRSVIATHGLSIYNSASHPSNENPRNIIYPLSGERSIYTLTQSWQ